MADGTSSTSSGSLAMRILIGAALLFLVLGALGWIVGVVVSVMRALVVIAALLAVAWLVLVGRGD